MGKGLTLVHVKNDDVRGLSNPPSALLTSLRLTVPRVLHLSLGSREKNRVVNFEAHALRRHEHAAFADQRLEPPQLSQTLSASPRAAAIDRAASTVPETHGSAGSHAELSPAVGPAPDSSWSMPSTALLCSCGTGCANDHPRSWQEAAGRRGRGGLEDVRYRSASERLLPPAHGPLANQLPTFTVGVWWPAEQLG